MRKMSLLIILLFILLGCTQEYAGNYRLECDSKRGSLGDKENFPDDFAMDWNQKTIIYAEDNYITSSQNEIEFLLTDEALDYLNEKLSGDKEALLDKFLEGVFYNDFKFVEEADKVEVDYLEDKIVMYINDENEGRVEGWQGIVIPEDRKFSEYKKIMESYEDSCKVIKD